MGKRKLLEATDQTTVQHIETETIVGIARLRNLHLTVNVQ